MIVSGKRCKFALPYQKTMFVKMKEMKSYIRFCLLLSAVLLFLPSCEKMVTDDDTPQAVETAGTNVVIRVADLEAAWADYSSRSLVDISEVCTRLCFAVYQNEKRVKYMNQKVGDSGFGTYSLQLSEGSYHLLVIGHSGAGNPATTNPAKVQFTNPGTSSGTGFTDTFYFYNDLTVTASGAQLDISMKRATAMFRLKTRDVKPANIKKFQFYYEGGSGVLDATTGLGCVNSKQTVMVETGDELTGQVLAFEMFTFLHQETGEVTFTVKAFDASDNILYEKEFANVKMQRNSITQYTGDFFTKDAPTAVPEEPNEPTSSGASAFVVKVDPEWAETFEYTY